MGCGSVSKSNQSIWLNPLSGLFRYKISILLNEQKKLLEFIHEDQFDEMPLTTLMNFIAFSEKDSQEFDANFVSRYNQENDSFYYQLQRLAGVEIDEKIQKEWILYVNKNKYTWDQVCQDNLRTKPQDSLLWVFQNFDENKV
jgi:hypothetical protein